MVNSKTEQHISSSTMYLYCIYNAYISLEYLGKLNIQLRTFLLNQLNEIKEEGPTDEHFRF